jgi:hypothetical protein
MDFGPLAGPRSFYRIAAAGNNMPFVRRNERFANVHSSLDAGTCDAFLLPT